MSMGRHGSGSSYERNTYGAFAFEHSENHIFGVTQLFKNGELWGVDLDTITKENCMNRANIGSGFFPYKSLESVFIETLANYMKFAKDILELPLPVRFIAGATNVKGYRMTTPDPFDRFAGSVVDDHIVYDEGLIESYDSEPTEILRPFFDYLWEECGLTRPNQDRLK